MSRTSMIYVEKSIPYTEIRSFMDKQGAQEVVTTRGGKYSFNLYSQDYEEFITIEFFPEFVYEIWEKSCEIELSEIQDKLGGKLSMCIELELSPGANPFMYEKIVFDVCSEWHAVLQNMAGNIFSCDDVKRTYAAQTIY